MTDTATAPEMGTAIGIKMAEVGNSAREHARSLAVLRSELRQHQRQALFDEAFTRAAVEVTQLILEELRAADAGNPGARNLSKPSNVAGRNKVYIQRVGKLVYLLSNGRDRMSTEEQARFIAAQPLK